MTNLNPASNDINAAETTAPKKAQMFIATVTPASIVHSVTQTGKPYISMKGATVATKNRPDNTRTVMVFGKVVDEVASALAEGQPVDLAVVPNGGTLNVVGLAWSAEERTARKAERRAA